MAKKIMILDHGSTFWIRNTACIYITPSVSLKSFQNVCFRGIEKMVVNAASIITRARGSDLVVKIKTAILQSDHPTAVNYMRNVDAIRQLYRRLV
jgi:hypothetical protein